MFLNTFLMPRYGKNSEPVPVRLQLTEAIIRIAQTSAHRPHHSRIRHSFAFLSWIGTFHNPEMSSHNFVSELSLQRKRPDFGWLYSFSSPRVFTIVPAAKTTVRNTESRTVNCPRPDRCPRERLSSRPTPTVAGQTALNICQSVLYGNSPAICARYCKRGIWRFAR